MFCGRSRQETRRLVIPQTQAVVTLCPEMLRRETVVAVKSRRIFWREENP